MSDPILIPRSVLNGIEAVRRSGLTNMIDRRAVVRLADQLGFHEAVLWLHGHPGDYARGVFDGFRAASEGGDPESQEGPVPSI